MNNRVAQIAAGCFTATVGAVLLLGHFFVDAHTASHTELYIGAGAMVVGLWLIAPVGMGGLIQQAQKSVPFLEDPEE